MAATETIRELKALLLAGRPEAWAQGYPAAVRDRICVYVAERRAAGATSGTIAGELGISRNSVLAWRPSTEGRARFRPVAVVAPAALAVTLAPSRVAPVLVTPKGYRVEGLDMAALAELLAAVG